MRKLSGIVILTLGSGATIIAAQPRSREGDIANTLAVASSSIPPAVTNAASSVSGRVSLLAPNARDVANAVVYLEPIAVPRPAPAPAPAPTVAAPPPVVAPRDTVRVLWDAVRELRQTVAELREAIRQIRLGFRPAEPRPTPSEEAAAARDTTAAPPSAAAPPVGATPVGVPTGAPAGTPGSSPERPHVAARVIPGVSIAMRDKTFEPHIRVVEAGGMVDYPNRDPFSHNVFSTTPGGAFDLGLYPRGETRGVVFRRAGSYAIYCNIHSKMSAFVVTVPSPHHTRPDASGRFSLADVPAGRYRLHVWHERAPEQITTVVVGDRDVSDVAVTLDARTPQPTAHLNKFGQPYRALPRSSY